MKQAFIVTADAAGQRLDVFCVQALPQYSRAALQKAIKEGQITLNGSEVKPRQVVVADDTIVAQLPEPTQAPATPLASLTIPILFEDKDVVVIDKPAGIAVHAGQGVPQATIASWLIEHYPGVVNVGEDPARPGIVHRLDQDTSGVLIMAKTQSAYEHLKKQFQHRRAHKEYLAVVFGVPGESKGRIHRALLRSKRNPLRRTIDPAGKDAITEWTIEEKLGNHYALLRVFPFTGRTHQIRAHLHFLGFPIVGDRIYTFKRQRSPHGVTRQLLHAAKLSLTLPNNKRKDFEAPLPADFANIVGQLRS